MCIACWFNAYSIIKRVSFSTTFVETISGLEEDSVLNSISPTEFSSWHPLCSLKDNRPCKMEGFQGGYRTSKSTVRTELWRCFLSSDFSSGLVNPRETQAFGDYLLKESAATCFPVPKMIRMVCCCICLTSTQIPGLRLDPGFPPPGLWILEISIIITWGIFQSANVHFPPDPPHQKLWGWGQAIRV